MGNSYKFATFAGNLLKRIPLVKISKIGDYFSLVKINHTIFSLPFALIGFFLAVKTPAPN